MGINGREVIFMDTHANSHKICCVYPTVIKSVTDKERTPLSLRAKIFVSERKLKSSRARGAYLLEL